MAVTPHCPQVPLPGVNVTGIRGVLEEDGANEPEVVGGG